MKVSSNKTAWIAVTFISMIIGVLLFLHSKRGPSIAGIQKMGHLAGLKVQVADVIDDVPVDNTFFGFPAGTVKALMVVRGDCLLTTDLRSAAFETTDKGNRTVTIALPTPTVSQPRVIFGRPGQGTEFHGFLKTGLAKVFSGDKAKNDANEAALRIAQQRVEDAGKSKEIVDAAKENTQNVLKGFMSPLGWNVTIDWK